MNKLLKLILSISIALALFVPVYGLQQAYAQWDLGQPVLDHPAGWELQQGDWIVANVAENTLQFVRADYSDISEKIRIGSGKVLPEGKKLSYLGMAYDPKTPEQVWEIRSEQQQHWYNVFGSKVSKEQLFLRLYEVKGDDRVWTHYGIHTTPEIESFFSNDEGFASWGCILARYDLLKKIQALYELNDHVVRVVTTHQQTEDIISLLKAF